MSWCPGGQRCHLLEMKVCTGFRGIEGEQVTGSNTTVSTPTSVLEGSRVWQIDNWTVGTSQSCYVADGKGKCKDLVHSGKPILVTAMLRFSFCAVIGEPIVPERMLSNFNSHHSPEQVTSSYAPPQDELLSADTTLHPASNTASLQRAAATITAAAAGRGSSQFLHCSSSSSSRELQPLMDVGSKQPLSLLGSLSYVIDVRRTAGVLRDRVEVLEEQLGVQQQVLDGLRAHQRDSELELRLQVCVSVRVCISIM